MIRTVAYYTESPTFGGAEQVLLTGLAGLDRRRWRPVLFHHPEPELAPLLEGARGLGVRTRALPRMQGTRALAPMAGLVAHLRAARPAIFHAHLNWPLACRHALLAAALARVPGVVATEHLFVPVPWRRSRYAQRLICRGVDRYIAVSQGLARRLRRDLRFPAHKVEVIYNGIPLAPFDRPVDTALRAALDGGTRRPVILTPARLDEQKGHRYLLEAAALIPDATIVLAGHGPQRAALEARARALGLDDRVTFLGYRPDIPALLRACDLVVLPSLFEGFPLVALEAMAAGKPLVATAISGTDEAVVHGETGVLIPPADPVALAEAIRTILTDRCLAQRMGTAGRARVRERFSAEAMAHHVERVYDDILRAREARDGRP